MRIKDHYFEVIFGKAPLHYTRTSDGVWIVENNPTNLADCYSDSESIFGMHMVWDEYLWQQLLKAAGLVVLGAILPNMLAPLAKTILAMSSSADIEFFKKIVGIVFTLCTDSFSGAVSETLLEVCLQNTDVGFLRFIVDSVFAFISTVNSSHTLYPQLFDYYIEELNYQIYIESDEGSYKLEDIRALMS